MTNSKLVRPSSIPFILLLMLGFHACSPTGVMRQARLEEDNLPDPADKGTQTKIQEDFGKTPKHLNVRSDGEFVFLESDGLPDHDMMAGIEAASMLVPLPQDYQEDNAWRLPIKPRKAVRGVSITDCFYRGVIAIAINGVPIVNPLNEHKVHSFTPGELDSFGGHCGCGRGDEYHYHLAPTHLQSIAGPGNPIAYALDGYPIYGFEDSDGKVPQDLDEFHGRIENGSYRYYASSSFPYVNGGMRGVVEIRDGQAVPQPTTWPLRAKVASTSAGKIIRFSHNPTEKSYSVQYIGNNYRNTDYVLKDKDTIEFKSDTMLNKTVKSVLRRSDPSAPIQPEESARRADLSSPTVILRVPNNYEGYLFFILDSKAPAMVPQYGRLVIDLPNDGVLHVPDLKPIGSHYSVFAEYMDGRKILTHTRKLRTDAEEELQLASLNDGGSGTKQDAKGKSISWIGFYVGKEGRPGVLPSFPPGL